MSGSLDQIEPARIQFLEQLLNDWRPLASGSVWSDLIRWAHRRIFLDGAPVSAIRAELSRGSSSVRVMAIASGKGGVGKTTVAVNLAVALAAGGARVLLFDADFGMANVHVFAGVTPRGTVLDVVDGRRQLEEIVVDGPGGVRLICGASGIGRLADLNAGAREGLGRELLRVAADYDVLLVDTGAGISPAVTHFLGVAEETIVVTTPNVAATLDAYGLIKVVHESRCKTRLHLLVNLTDDEGQARGVHEKIAGCASRFLQTMVHSLGFLERDAAMEQANQRRRPVVLDQPGNRNSQRLARMAAVLNDPIGAAAASAVGPAAA